MALQPGEKINHIILGDPDHWKVEPAEEGGPGGETLHLIIRAASPDLDTSMVVLTKARSYHVRLQSHRRDYMLQVAFTYPEAAPVAAPVRSSAAMPAKQTESVAQDNDDDGFVKVGDITYVKGREPKSLVTSGKAAEPPQPAAVPRPEVSKEVPRIIIPQ
jgi:type IV secretory pathway VirB9-like protein